jgi:hypothetical protein
MSKVKDLTDQVFGRLTVLKQAAKPETEKRKGAWWLVRCECGNELPVRGATLTIGDRTSCGCFQNPNRVGERFGKLVVLSKASSRKQGSKNRSYWLCKCDCGNVCEISGHGLTSGDNRSCGCLHSPDNTGEKFDRLLALERVEPSDPRNQTPHVKYLCLCDCGNEVLTSGNRLRSGEVRSCGCLIRESITTHGMSKTRTYRIWAGMKSRCLNPNEEAYERYGGRGITVCDRWLNSFENFLEDMGEAPEGLTIERKNGAQGYSPDNCRWATYQEQGENKSNNFWITVNPGTPEEETHTVSEWGRIKGLCHATISQRIRTLGWDVNRALNTPVRRLE